MPPPKEIPKGRRLRGCDAVAVPIYQVDKHLLSAVFATPRAEAERTSARTPVLSPEHLKKLDLQEPERQMVRSRRHATARSEGTSLTPEEVELIRSGACDDAGAQTSSEEDEGDWGSDDERCKHQGPLIQANGSAYRALALGETKGAVGIGISRAFFSSQECHGRHATLMLGGGKFAACIFSETGKVEHHKVFKRYVVRGKQGGAQSSHDKKGGKAKSIGAQMRREGEKRLAEDVQALLGSWAVQLQSCRVVLVSIPAQRQGAVFGQLLQASDPRVRKIPFPSLGKPGLEACVRAHALVCSALFFRSWPHSAHVEGIPCLPASNQFQREALVIVAQSPREHANRPRAEKAGARGLSREDRSATSKAEQ